MKLKKKNVIIAGAAFLIMLSICLIVILVNASERNAGKVVNGVVKYSDKILNASKASTKVIELKSINESMLDTVIMTPEKLEKIKNEDKLYTMDLKDLVKESSTPNRDIYNINKAIELKIVSENDDYIKFLYKVSGFRSKKNFIKFCDNAFNLMK